MPHLLIAGATGSGKSVCINTLITSLVYRYTPAELRFLMIDPKMVELSMYNALPHLRHRVVTDNKDAAHVLKWAVWEMQDRYELLHANNARNLVDFNHKLAEDPTKIVKPNGEAYEEGALPYILLFVDELADLIMTVQAEVETPLALLAQKARAIGIHLILATQRPSVNVITGLIKANFPCRIAFRVASKIDSRTILDQNGAEALLGNGDMLFMPPGKSDLMRLQGAFVGTDETEKLMHWFDARREERLEAAAEAAAAADGAEAEGARPTSSRSCVRASPRRKGARRAAATPAPVPRTGIRSSARPRRSASRTSSARRRSSSAASRSATAARRGSSISCTTRESSGRRMDPKRGTCSWGSPTWISTELAERDCGRVARRTVASGYEK